MGQTFMTNIHPSFERTQKHKAALAAMVRDAVDAGMAEASTNAKAKPQGNEDDFDWIANLPSEADAPARVANKDLIDPWAAMLSGGETPKAQPVRASQTDDFDWIANLPSEKGK